MAQHEIEEALIRATLSALRPFVRRLLTLGVTFGRLEARLRELFVEVAARGLAQPGTIPTDSQVSIRTGINRKEVRRLRSRDRGTAPRTFTRNLAASVISRWTGDPRTTDGRGRPVPLPYDARRGPSFVALARKTTADLHPRALLDALIATGAAELRQDDVVVLTRAAYVPDQGRPEALDMLADDPPELFETMLHNVLDDADEPRLQQKLAFDNIGSDGLARLRATLRREAEKFLDRAEKQLVRHDRDRNPRAPGGDRRSAGVGIYYFEKDTPDAKEPKSLAGPARKRIRRKQRSR